MCEHCAEVLQNKLEENGFGVNNINLGDLTLEEKITDSDLIKLQSIINENGFEIIDDENSRIVEQIKKVIIDLVRTSKTLDGNLSNHLSKKLHKDYQQLSRLFSAVEGKSIERYFILQKIERAKELIVYDELTLSEIAYELDYSSQQHFSRQFKKETGLAPSHFKNIKENKRISIDRI